MVKNIGISQQALVVDTTGSKMSSANKFPQYMAGVSATLGAMAAGMVLGWTSAAGKNGIDLAKEYNIPLTADEFSWIGSLVTLGAAAICVPIGILSDLIGRKTAMLLLVIPFTIGWLFIIMAKSILMFYVGRFVTGLSGGAFCVTAPMYTAEISESSIRGTLGSYFQLMLVIGILLSYGLGPAINMYNLSLISAVVPVVFFCVFIFMPETPIYYLRKGNRDAAKASLLRLRGSHYNVEPELQALEESLMEEQRKKTSLAQALRTKAARKGLVIAFGLMFFQQLSGINAIIFYAGSIFESANKSISVNVSTLIVGIIQVIAVFLSTLVVDKLGRRILLFVSIVVMLVTTFFLGTYFYLQRQTSVDVTHIGWLPLLCVCVFIFLFSVGFGPIPWLMIGELFSSTTKGISGSSACFFNWLMAFVVTKYYSSLELAAGTYTCFWLFSAICAIGSVFVLVLVPETKGKTLEEIQHELGGQSSSNEADKA
ncbi:PREDICTED: facilitated trehalose transporter Tret1-2 homolog isoform X2 [Ceratosolen solmsi marchali]|nr:PREDICTED: facilitated trehalose transporter Tret1-2 homolog isoform X2 [Ceratosolen solmsi marchali]